VVFILSKQGVDESFDVATLMVILQELQCMFASIEKPKSINSFFVFFSRGKNQMIVVCIEFVNVVVPNLIFII